MNTNDQNGAKMIIIKKIFFRRIKNELSREKTESEPEPEKMNDKDLFVVVVLHSTKSYK